MLRLRLPQLVPLVCVLFTFTFIPRLSRSRFSAHTTIATVAPRLLAWCGGQADRLLLLR
jgi:hypothetical protein